MAADFKRNRIAVILSLLILVLILLATFGASATEETIDDSIACYYVDSLDEVEDATTLSENIILIEENSPGEYSIFDYCKNAVYTDYGITVEKSVDSPSIDNDDPPSLYLAETDISDENIQELIEDPSSSWEVGSDSNLELLDSSGNIILNLYPVSDTGYFSGKDLKINCNVSYGSDYSAATLSLSLTSKSGKTVALNKLKLDYSFDGGKTWNKNNTYTIKENSTIKLAIRDKVSKLSFSDSVKVTGIASSIKIIHEDNDKYDPADGKYLSAAIFQKSQEDGKCTLVAYAKNSVFKNADGYIVKSNQLYDNSNLSTELFLYFFDPKKLTKSDIVGLQPFEMTEGADITMQIGSKKVKVYTAIPEVEKETPKETPVLDLESIKFEKISGSSYDLSVKNSDEVQVSFSIKDENSMVDESSVCVTFNNEKVAAYKKDGDTYYCTFTIDETMSENQFLQLTKIEYADKAGNITAYDVSDESIGDTFLSDIVYYAPFSYDETVYGCDFKADKRDGTATAYAKDNDIVYVTFKTTHPINTVKGNFYMSSDIPISLTDDSEGINEFDGDKYIQRIAFTVTNDAAFDQENIAFNFTISDTAGNEIEIANTVTTESGFSWDSVTYYASFKYDETILDCNFKADKRDGTATAYAKDGDIVYVSFKTTHPISAIDGSFYMLNVIPISLTGESEGINEIDGDKYTHRIAFTVTNDAAFDQENIAFNFTISDTAGNKIEISNTDTTESGFCWDSVTYYAPIEVSELSFYSNNSAGRKDLIKNGENVYWDFKTQHTVNASLEIGDEAVNLAETSQNNWSAMESLDDGKINGTSISDNKEIHYKISITDIAGNSLIYDSTSHELTSDSVTYYAPISISSLTMKSNNSKTPEVVAKNGDIITVRFASGHPVSLVDNRTEVDENKIYPYIAGTAVEFSSENGTNWTGTYTVKSGDTSDQAYINLGFSLTDAAGNETVDYTQEKSQ